MKIYSMENVEGAYQEIAKSILDFVSNRVWDIGIFESKIYSQMAMSNCYLISAGVKNSKAIGWGDSSIDSGGAALFLRDHLLRVTGQRIWGLTFTLHPNGKFDINYDYEKPEGYEEIDEIITGDEINSSLSNLNQENKKS